MNVSSLGLAGTMKEDILCFAYTVDETSVTSKQPAFFS